MDIPISRSFCFCKEHTPVVFQGVREFRSSERTPHVELTSRSKGKGVEARGSSGYAVLEEQKDGVQGRGAHEGSSASEERCEDGQHPSWYKVSLLTRPVESERIPVSAWA